jgi:hypothetical protein
VGFSPEMDTFLPAKYKKYNQEQQNNVHYFSIDFGCEQNFVTGVTSLSHAGGLF